MKSINEIFARAVVLFCMYERCKVEKEVIDNRFGSKERGENQCITINRWMREKGYAAFLTESERTFFKESLGSVKKEKINALSQQYEAIRPLMWAIGIVDELAPYSDFDSDCFGDHLQINGKHNFDLLSKACRLRSKEEIAMQTEAAMLWHWRAIEIGQVPKDGRSWGECVKMIFGDEYKEVLKHISQATQTPKDFLVGGKPVSDLNETEQSMLKIIAYWRHHAFEWIMGDDAWDEVSVDT